MSIANLCRINLCTKPCDCTKPCVCFFTETDSTWLLKGWWNSQTKPSNVDQRLLEHHYVCNLCNLFWPPWENLSWCVHVMTNKISRCHAWTTVINSQTVVALRGIKPLNIFHNRNHNEQLLIYFLKYVSLFYSQFCRVPSGKMTVAQKIDVPIKHLCGHKNFNLHLTHGSKFWCPDKYIVINIIV